MKLRVRDRLCAAVLGLLVMAGSACAAWHILRNAPAEWRTWVALAACVVAFLLGVCGVAMLFRRKHDKGFVIQQTEYGDISISVKAIENMVKRCVDAQTDLHVTQTSIFRVRNGINVHVKVTLPSGLNIPLTVGTLQKQIKQYITDCSGVDVHTVAVKVETDVAKLPAPQQAEGNVEPEMPADLQERGIEAEASEMPVEPVAQAPVFALQTSEEEQSMEAHTYEVPAEAGEENE